jgi:hypothetical protein
MDMNIKNLFKKSVMMLVLASLSASLFAEENVTTLVNPGLQSVTPEKYTLELRASKIEDNIFPVAVNYFDYLLTPRAKLRATLNVPLRLTIESSRKRRLLTVFSQSSRKAIPYGSSLKNVTQIKRFRRFCWTKQKNISCKKRC